MHRYAQEWAVLLYTLVCYIVLSEQKVFTITLILEYLNIVNIFHFFIHLKNNIIAKINILRKEKNVHSIEYCFLYLYIKYKTS